MSTDYANGGIPKTIEELKDYCERNGFTSSKTRFFVGFDYKGAKAFGVYKDEATGEFVVYKNKADGTRSVRYRGTDEEFAVVELYDRLQSEIANQKLHYAADMAERERNKYERGDNSAYDRIKSFNINDYPLDSDSDSYDDRGSSGHSSGRGGYSGLGTGMVVIAIIIMLMSSFSSCGGGRSGGYHGSSGGGYHYNSDYDYDSGWSSDSWDSDWSSDDWDSGYTDWDSDW